MKNYRLYLVRHGVTQGNLDGIIWAAGRTSPVRTGRGAAARVAARSRIPKQKRCFKPYAPRGGDCGAAVPGRKG